MSDAERIARAREVAVAARDAGELVCVVGPTAAGKTALAIALAEALDGEIVSADSVQIYRGFDLGSGKPTPEERARAPHHLLDTHDPHEHVDAAGYAELADAAVRDVRGRGKLPIVCGGTFFWVRSLVLGLAEAPPADDAIRARHRALVDASGRDALHAALAAVDAASAARLHPNDVVRVSRALEVFELSGKPMSVWHAEHGFRAPRHRARFLGPATTPDELRARVRARAHAWLASGFVEEVRALLARGHGATRPMGSVGYKEVHAHLRGELPAADLEDAVVRATMLFTRRQRTWLNHETVAWV